MGGYGLLGGGYGLLGVAIIAGFLQISGSADLWFSLCFPMVFVWFLQVFYSFPKARLSFFHCFLIVFRWFSLGFLMVFLRFSHGFPMVSQWFSYGFPMVFPVAGHEQRRSGGGRQLLRVCIFHWFFLSLRGVRLIRGSVRFIRRGGYGLLGTIF